MSLRPSEEPYTTIAHLHAEVERLKRVEAAGDFVADSLERERDEALAQVDYWRQSCSRQADIAREMTAQVALLPKPAPSSTGSSGWAGASVKKKKRHKSKGGVYTCLNCQHRGWRLTIRSRCPMCGTKATVANTV